MYRCDNCKEVSRLGAKRHMVVVATRENQFPFRAGAHHFRREGADEVKDDPGGVGRQIVKEIGVCRPCQRLVEGVA